MHCRYKNRANTAPYTTIDTELRSPEVAENGMFMCHYVGASCYRIFFVKATCSYVLLFNIPKSLDYIFTSCIIWYLIQKYCGTCYTTDQRNLLQEGSPRSNQIQESSSSSSSSPSPYQKLDSQIHIHQQPLSPVSPLQSSSSLRQITNNNNNNETCWTKLKAELWTWFKPLDRTHTHEDVVYACLILFPLWFLANILYNYSLLYTSISSSTIIR